MAKWTDGPEYAPGERPDAFVVPETEPLSSAEPPPAPDPYPAQVPGFGAPDGVRPLGESAPSVDERRDPARPFPTMSSVLTPAPASLRTDPATAGSRPGTTPLGPAAPGLSGPASGPPPASPSPPVAPASPSPPVAPAPSSSWGAAHVPQATAWGAAHAAPAPAPWAPAQPFTLPEGRPPLPPPAGAQPHPAPQVNPQAFSPAGDQAWSAPYGAPTPSSPRPTTAKTLVEAVTPGVLLALLVGGVLPAASAVMLVAASLLARRTRYRHAMVRTAFLFGIGVPAVAAFQSTLFDYGISWRNLSYASEMFWDSFNWWSRLACWVLIGVLALIQRGALRRGEPPEVS